MAQHVVTHRFAPGIWATVESTGEHVKVELWSNLANAYRVNSAANGVQFFEEADLNEVPAYPDEDFSRDWSRCRRTGCGAPLTAGLPTCERCKSPICTCGRCTCTPAAARAKTKTTTAKTSKKARLQAAAEAAKADADADAETDADDDADPIEADDDPTE